MPDVDINTGARQSNFVMDAGTIRITPAGSPDDYVLANLEGGVSWQAGGRITKAVKDNGEFTGSVLDLGDNETSFSFTVRHQNDLADANALYDLFNQAVSGGLIPMGSIQFKQPDTPGAIIGTTITFDNVPLDPKALSITSADDGDTIEFRGVSYAGIPTVASY